MREWPAAIVIHFEASFSAVSQQPPIIYDPYNSSIPYFGLRGKSLPKNDFCLPFSCALNQNNCLAFQKRTLPGSRQKVISFPKMALRKPFRFSYMNKTTKEV